MTKQSRTTRATIVAFAALALAIGARAHGAETFFDLDATIGHDSNVSHGDRDMDVESDSFGRARGGISVLIPAGDKSGFVLGARADLTGSARFSDLNRAALRLSVRYEFQTRLAFGAPRYTLHGHVEPAHYGSRIRTGVTYVAGASVGRRLTDRVRVGAGYAFEDRHSDGTAFDTTNHVFSGNAEYRLGGSAVLYGRIAARLGEDVWTARGWPELTAAAKARDPDPAFGPGRWAWRLDANTFVGALGLNLPIARNQSVDLLVESYLSDGDGDNEYDGTALSVAYLLRF